MNTLLASAVMFLHVLCSMAVGVYLVTLPSGWTLLWLFNVLNLVIGTVLHRYVTWPLYYGRLL